MDNRRLYLVEEAVMKECFDVRVLEREGIWRWIEAEGPIIRAAGEACPGFPDHVQFETDYGCFAIPRDVVEEIEK